MRPSYWRAAVGLGAAVLLSGCVPTGDREPAAVVFAAASTVTALEGIARAFESERGVPIVVNYAGSATLAQQIERGAAADVFISADSAWVDRLEARGFVAQRSDFLENTLVLVVPAVALGGIGEAADLAEPEVERVAVGDPDSVPAGAYARDALQRLGLWDAVEPKAVRAADVRQALLYAERGEVSAAIVYGTDAASSGRVQVVETLDPHLTEPIRYAVALTRRGADRHGAQAFFSFLQSAKAERRFTAAGFRLLSNAAVDMD